jgi:hypothetical protein
VGWSMNAQHGKSWPAINLAELKYGLAFGSSVEEMADFLHRDVEDVKHRISVEAQRAEGAAGAWDRPKVPRQH